MVAFANVSILLIGLFVLKVASLSSLDETLTQPLRPSRVRDAQPAPRWRGEPPFWEGDPQHPNRAFGPEDAQKCMFNRTLYVLGNSIARQWAFSMVASLGGEFVDRNNQKAECPKNALDWGDSCHQLYNGVTIKYLFLEWFDGYEYKAHAETGGQFPYYYKDMENKTAGHGSIGYSRPDKSQPGLWKSDNCGNKQTRDCLRAFFGDATPATSNDVVIFTLGMMYTMSHFQQEVWTLDTDKKPRFAVDTKAWMTESAKAFATHIDATFPGTVFRVGNAATIGAHESIRPMVCTRDL